MIECCPYCSSLLPSPFEDKGTYFLQCGKRDHIFDIQFDAEVRLFLPDEEINVIYFPPYEQSAIFTVMVNKHEVKTDLILSSIKEFIDYCLDLKETTLFQ